LLGLLSYPLMFELLLSQGQQRAYWCGAYLLFVLLACISTIRSAFSVISTKQVNTRIAWSISSDSLLCMALAACASILWLAVANYLSHEVAPVPFLWILPLTLYLLTFILCFEMEDFYRPSVFRWLLPIALAVVCGLHFALYGRVITGFRWEIIVLSFALFICCLFCHGELARKKPESTEGLTHFYLMVALGGLLGTVFVGFVAPKAFKTYMELPIGMMFCLFLARMLLYGYTSFRQLVLWSAGSVAAVIYASGFGGNGDHIVNMRNFYGTLAIRESGAGDMAVRTLYNGDTLHGLEFLSPSRQQLPTAYYGPQSGIGVLLRSEHRTNLRVGIVGLGIGTLATYGRKGDLFRFYEVNPAVVQAATKQFRYMTNSAARVDVVIGDGRLALIREPEQNFDILVLDAFSGDAIPIHLLTWQAFEIYFDRLRQGGVVAIHVSNRYLDLASVVRSAAEALGKQVREVYSSEDKQSGTVAADWLFVSSDAQALRKFDPISTMPVRNRKVRLWTDTYSNLFQVLK
jgi:spermidine synthase